MGAGKTTVGKILNKKLDGCVFLDGDWLWYSDPFCVNAETKELVVKNICYVLNNFLSCASYKNIVFCWVMNEQNVIDKIIGSLNIAECEVKAVSLLCGESELRKRLQNDVDEGVRTADVIERSVARLPFYKLLDTIKIYTDGKTPDEIAEEIISLPE